MGKVVLGGKGVWGGGCGGVEGGLSKGGSGGGGWVGQGDGGLVAVGVWGFGWGVKWRGRGWGAGVGVVWGCVRWGGRFLVPCAWWPCCILGVGVVALWEVGEWQGHLRGGGRRGRGGGLGIGREAWLQVEVVWWC